MSKNDAETERPRNFVDDVPAELAGSEKERFLPATRRGGMLATPGDMNVSTEGVRPPFLQLVHGVGDLAESFNPGDLVLAKEHLVCPKGTAIEAIMLNVAQYYKERVSEADRQAGIYPRTFNDKEAAAAAGLQVDWGADGSGPQAGPAMDMILLLRKPEAITCPLFTIELSDGQSYALAAFSADKTNYRTVINDVGLVLRHKVAKTGKFHSALWKIHTELGRPSRKTGNRTQITRFTFLSMLEPALIEEIGKSIEG